MAERVRAAGLLLAATIAVGGFASGCVGGGDDTLAPAIADASGAGEGGSDARSSEGSTGTGDATTPDAGPEGAVGDAVATDATLSGGDDGGPSTGDGGVAAGTFTLTPIDLLAVDCGGTASQSWFIQNHGTAALAIATAVVGTAFRVSPGSFMVAPGMTGSLTVTASVPDGASAGDRLSGVLNVFTNDPSNKSLSVPLYATATGGTIAFQQANLTALQPIVFPTTKVGIPAAPIDVAVVNLGNAPVTITAGGATGSGSAELSFTPTAAGGVVLNPGQVWTGQAGFTPAVCSGACTQKTASVNIATSDAICGNSLTQFTLAGTGTTAQIAGDRPLQFSANCGGSAPPAQDLLLTNHGTVVVNVTQVVRTGPFTDNLPATPIAIAPDGGVLDVRVTAPPFPPGTGAPGSMPAPLQGTLSLSTDTNQTLSIPFTESPLGASLSFDTTSAGCTSPGVASFSQFGSAAVLASTPVTHTFCLSNSGTASAQSVAVSLQTPGAHDAGVGDGASTAGAPFDIVGVDPGAPLTIAQVAAGSDVQEHVSFTPQMYGGVAQNLVMTVDPLGTILCAPLPAALPMAGSGTGGGPSVGTTFLEFDAPCDGATPPGSKTVVLSNAGTLDMSWTGVRITGPGAARFSVPANLISPSSGTMTAQPGILHPGEYTSITVQAGDPMPSGATSGVAAPSLTELSAVLTILTDVPNSDPVVSLQEVPIGDQISIQGLGQASSLRFGQVPVNATTSPQTLTITNTGNPGSPTANVTMSTGGAPGYGLPPSVSLAPGGGAATIGVRFSPTTPASYPATLSFATADMLCAPLPRPISLVGTGIQGAPTISPTTKDFGPVHCGGVASAGTFTVTNGGNQPLTVLGMSLDKGAASPYGPPSGPSLPLVLGVNGSGTNTMTFTVAPKPIPAVTDPSNADQFGDTLRVATDVLPLAVPLSMHAQGAIVSVQATTPVFTFGNNVVGIGSIDTIPNAANNSGNLPATAQLVLQSQAAVSPTSVFGLQSDPTVLPGNAVTSIVGQFVPSTPNGIWADTGNILLTADAFCGLPPQTWTAVSPTQWQSPSFAVSGRSTSTPPVTATGSLAFSPSECGGATPGPQSIVLTNGTNQSLAVTAALEFGTHYTLSINGSAAGDAGATGTIPANSGVVTIAVTPRPVLPGPGILPGSAPYGDTLVVSVGPAAAPLWTSTFPVSWQLNGAVLSLGQGPPNTFNSHRFYVADTTSGFTLSLLNTGNEAATVLFGIPPSAAYSVVPASPISVPAVLGAQPQLFSASGAPVCPTQSVPNATLTLTPQGSVCQPLQDPVTGAVGSSVTVEVLACSGTY